MIFIVHPDKTVTTLLEQVNVGDNTTDIVVISPFSGVKSCMLKYRLPDGEVGEPQFLEYMGKGSTLGLGYEGSVYVMKISPLMTEFMGSVQVTIVFTGADKKELVCETASFTVGCFPSFLLPAYSEQDTDIAAQIQSIQSTIENAILPIIDEASGAAAAARDSAANSATSAQQAASSAQEAAAGAREASVQVQVCLRYAEHAESSATAAQQSAENATNAERQAELYAQSYKLPDVTQADNGKCLRVVNGAWAPLSVDTGITAQGLEAALAAERAKIKFYATPDAEENPAALFGGDWTRIENRFLLGIGDAYPMRDAQGSILLEGGSADAVVVSHRHTWRAVKSTAVASSDGYIANGDYNKKAYEGDIATNEVGVDGTGKNMPPYYGMYLWRRLTQEEIENASA